MTCTTIRDCSGPILTLGPMGGQLGCKHIFHVLVGKNKTKKTLLIVDIVSSSDPIFMESRPICRHKIRIKTTPLLYVTFMMKLLASAFCWHFMAGIKKYDHVSLVYCD